MDGQGVKTISDLGAEAAGAKLRTIEVAGVTYGVGGLHAIHRKLPERQALSLSSLSGLVDYIKADPDALVGPLIVHVASQTRVSLLGAARADDFHSREHLALADYSLGVFQFGRWMDRESFNIALQSQFAPVADWDPLIQIIANIVDANVVEAKDNGFSQSVTAKAGISAAVLEKVTAPNPVVLAPYRSFPEIEPVVSSFVFRMRGGGGKPVEVALFEADGGRWQVDTVQKLFEELSKRLASEIEAKKVVLVR